MERGQQFPYEMSYSYDPSWNVHTYTAHHKGTQVGYMTLGEAGGVSDIHVDPEHRRKGVATALWNHAMNLAYTTNSHGEMHPFPEHSGQRTDDGDAWAKSTGEAHYFEPEEIHHPYG